MLNEHSNEQVAVAFARMTPMVTTATVQGFIRDHLAANEGASIEDAMSAVEEAVSAIPVAIEIHLVNFTRAEADALWTDPAALMAATNEADTRGNLDVVVLVPLGDDNGEGGASVEMLERLSRQAARRRGVRLLGCVLIDHDDDDDVVTAPTDIVDR